MTIKYKQKYNRVQDRSLKDVIPNTQEPSLDEENTFANPKFQEIATQKDLSMDDIDQMQKDMEQIKLDNVILKQHIQTQSDTFSKKDLQDDEEKVRHLTGLQSIAVLTTLFDFLEPHISSRLSLDKFRMYILTLMRLRLNLSMLFLSYIFGVSQSTASRIFNSVIDVMFVKMRHLVFWPEREALQKTMPMDFRKHSGMKCVCIIDCFEVFIERPSTLKARAETWSSYKHHNTVKFLIAITPQGFISYISKAWGGRTSDKYLTEHCGFLNNLLPGDLVLADRGFDIGDSVGSMCAQVKIPAFTKGKNQLSPIDIETSRQIAHSRIHVERVIGVVRQKYTILNGTIPISFLDTKSDEDTPLIDKCGHICCSLVNLCDSVVDFN